MAHDGAYQGVVQGCIVVGVLLKGWWVVGGGDDGHIQDQDFTDTYIHSTYYLTYHLLHIDQINLCFFHLCNSSSLTSFSAQKKEKERKSGINRRFPIHDRESIFWLILSHERMHEWMNE